MSPFRGFSTTVWGLWKVALSAGPLAAPATPVPAAVATTMAVPGASRCARPAHEAAQAHSTGGAAAPEHQYPAGQGAPEAVEEAGRHAQPGAAAQGRQAAGEAALSASLKVPAGHATARPDAHQKPRPQGAHVSARTAAALENTTRPVAGTTATPTGAFIHTSAPVASAAPRPPLPASVTTAHVAGATRRMRSPPAPNSATTSEPEGARAMPAGLVKRAAAHAPSALPAVPLPARVDTAPSGATARSAWFCMSVTNATPAAPTTTEKGALKRAVLPTPSANPEAPARPARVTTKPVGATVRTVCEP